MEKDKAKILLGGKTRQFQTTFIDAKGPSLKLIDKVGLTNLAIAMRFKTIFDNCGLQLFKRMARSVNMP